MGSVDQRKKGVETLQSLTLKMIDEESLVQGVTNETSFLLSDHGLIYKNIQDKETRLNIIIMFSQEFDLIKGHFSHFLIDSKLKIVLAKILRSGQ